jgi:hypothetical protein
MIFGVVLAGLVVLTVRYAVDTTDGRDWMERHVQ